VAENNHWRTKTTTRHRDFPAPVGGQMTDK